MRSTGKSPTLVLVTLVTATITLCAQVGPQETASGQTQERLAKATRETMINVLGSAGANPSRGEEAKSYDHLDGTWSRDYTFDLTDANVCDKNAVVQFGWVDDCQAKKDLLIGF